MGDRVVLGLSAPVFVFLIENGGPGIRANQTLRCTASSALSQLRSWVCVISRNALASGSEPWAIVQRLILATPVSSVAKALALHAKHDGVQSTADTEQSQLRAGFWWILLQAHRHGHW